MKIQKVIMSVDDNPLYSDFWPLVSMVWKNRFDIEPVLIYFGNEKLDERYGEVKKIDPVKNIPLYLQAQWARIWFTSLEEETVFITSDIDIFPIRKSFFIDQISEIDDDKYVHLFGNHRPLPICYHVAKGKMFKKILELNDSFEESMHELISNNFYGYHMGFDRWGVDEHCSNQKILNYKNKEEIFLLFNDVGPRLDRSNWPNIYHVDDYIDCHSVRPVKDYTKELQNLINKLK